MSRCNTFAAWAAATASATVAAHAAASRNAGGPARTRDASVPPGTSSIEKNGRPASSPTS